MSSGRTPAKTANCSGWTASGIGPGGQMAPSSPTAFATMAAVAGASPVTITVPTPRSRNSLTSAAESLRGGSLSAISPTSFIAVAGPAATANTRKPLFFEFLGGGRRRRRCFGKADNDGVSALHDLHSDSCRVRSGCLRHLVGWVEGNKPV